MDSSMQLIALFRPSLSCKPERDKYPQFFFILLLSLSHRGCVPHSASQQPSIPSPTTLSSFRAVEKWRMDWISVSLWETNLLMWRAELVPYSSASSCGYSGCRAHGGTSAPLQKSNGAQNELWMWIHFLSLSDLYQSISASLPPSPFLSFLCGAASVPFLPAPLYSATIVLSSSLLISQSVILRIFFITVYIFIPSRREHGLLLKSIRGEVLQLEERTKSREKSVIKGGGRLEGENNPPANHTSSCGPANKLSRCSRSWAGGQITAQFPAEVTWEQARRDESFHNKSVLRWCLNKSGQWCFHQTAPEDTSGRNKQYWKNKRTQNSLMFLKRGQGE